MIARSERFEMRLDQGTLDKVDAWRGDQPDMPSRAEAMRRLVEAGIRASERVPVQFTDGERVIVGMLRDLYKQPKDRELDPEFLFDAISNGHNWAIPWKYSGIIPHEIDNEATVSEVVNILDMWWAIERAFAELPDADKKHLQETYGGLGRCRFLGFDGNNEIEHMSIAEFIVNRLGRFTTFKDRDLNSHFPVLDRYRAMLTVYEPMRKTLLGVELDLEQLLALQKAGIPPRRQPAG